jgi:hypothetical protein
MNKRNLEKRGKDSRKEHKMKKCSKTLKMASITRTKRTKGKERRNLFENWEETRGWRTS